MSNKKDLSTNLSNLGSIKNCFNFFRLCSKFHFPNSFRRQFFLNIWQQHCLQSNVIAPPICHCTNAASCMEHFYHTSKAAKLPRLLDTANIRLISFSVINCCPVVSSVPDICTKKKKKFKKK